MRVEIFDVGHGQCAVITAPNGRRMMIDCGDRWGEEAFWTPSLHYFGQTVDLLALTNLDEDHLSDFKGMPKIATCPGSSQIPPLGHGNSRSLRKTEWGRALKPWHHGLPVPEDFRLRSRISGRFKSDGILGLMSPAS